MKRSTAEQGAEVDEQFADANHPQISLTVMHNEIFRLYQYREKWGPESDPGRYIIHGEKKVITTYIPKKEFAELFGGYCIWGLRKKWYQLDGESIGVYGKRQVSRFKRILSDRGAKFTVINSPQPKSRLKSITKDFRPKLRKMGIIK